MPPNRNPYSSQNSRITRKRVVDLQPRIRQQRLIAAKRAQRRPPLIHPLLYRLGRKTVQAMKTPAHPALHHQFTMVRRKLMHSHQIGQFRQHNPLSICPWVRKELIAAHKTTAGRPRRYDKMSLSVGLQQLPRSPRACTPAPFCLTHHGPIFFTTTLSKKTSPADRYTKKSTLIQRIGKSFLSEDGVKSISTASNAGFASWQHLAR